MGLLYLYLTLPKTFHPTSIFCQTFSYDGADRIVGLNSIEVMTVGEVNDTQYPVTGYPSGVSVASPEPNFIPLCFQY
jgi:hypothetical protein